MIPQEVIDRICEKDLLSFLEGEGLSFIKKGAEYWCCCPFHGEKTASFKVSPSRNTYHCFGCGESGNIISYVMKMRGLRFFEAVEFLADKFGIEYEKREETAEEMEERFRKERTMMVNDIALKFFRSQLQAPAARDYIKMRGWSDKAVEDFAIGYAPGGNALLKHFRESGWTDEKFLHEAGLLGRNDETGEYYDYFRQRVVFPVRNRTGYVMGFTGRDVTGKNDRKYINTPNTSPLFKKGADLYGWYEAQRMIREREEVILCEGNPDVIRLSMIGQTNAVAPMGTAFTADQADRIANVARKVIIIGDNDKAGIDAVIKNGRLLLEKGLAVRVMFVPGSKETDKDADEYFKHNPTAFDDCLAAYTQDYIPWMTDRMMEGKSSTTEKAEVIRKICQLLAYVDDDSTAEMYLDQFTKNYKNGPTWKKEYYGAKNIRKRQTERDKDALNMLSEFGFYIKDNCYYGAGTRDNDRRWSNFIMKPILHIRDEKNAKRIYLMSNNRGQEAVVKMNQSEMVSFADFKTRTETAGNFIWEAGQSELTALKKHLYEDTPSADEIRQMGWQKRFGFYAFGNGGLDGEKFIKADRFGIIEIRGRRFYIPGCSEDTEANTHGYLIQRKFIHAETNDVTLGDYARLLTDVFGNNARVALCFLIATLFKDIVIEQVKFPLLLLFGPKGTGKSNLGQSLASFFVRDAQPQSISSTTKAGMAELVAEVSNAIVHLDEYKDDIPLEKREFLKGIWDGTGRTRLNMEDKKSRESTAVDCGVVMSGQELPMADPALFSRTVFLGFSRTTFSDDERRRFEELKRTESRGLTHLTLQILRYRQRFKDNFRSCYEGALGDMSRRVHSYNVEDRTLKNWAAILGAFRSLEGSLDLPFDYARILDICVTGCIEQHQKTAQNNELASFWKAVSIMLASGKIWQDVDYRIAIGKGEGFKIRESKIPCELTPGKKYLFIDFNRISSAYAKEGRETQTKTIPTASLEFYLKNAPEFLGTKPGMRFKIAAAASGIGGEKKSHVLPAMIFDYESLVRAYDINLEGDIIDYLEEPGDYVGPQPALFDGKSSQGDDLPN